MLYNKIVFNGKYLVKDNLRGVHRYTHQILCALDDIIEPDLVEILVPHTDKKLPEFKNIAVKQYGGKIARKGWQYIAFQYYILKEKALAVCLSSGAPLIKTGIIAIHDVRYLEDKADFHELKKKWNHFCIKLFAKMNIKNAAAIITVSEFSKAKICHYYHCSPDKVIVLHAAWQHMKGKAEDDNIFKKYPEIPKKGGYYFYLGGLEKNKNLQWILKLANDRTEDFFVLAGPPSYLNEKNETDWRGLKNIKHVGYISDEELISLIKNAKAFLFPSLYEGFGLPPLEAMALGTPALISNSTCLPEIYGKDLQLFDPSNFDVDFDELLIKNKGQYNKVLERYSWNKSALNLKLIMEDMKTV